MQVIRTKRAGVELRTLVKGKVANRKARKASKHVTNRWVRADIFNPERNDLTKAEWCRRGDFIRGIKRNAPEIVGIDELSLNDLADIHASCHHCTTYRVVAQVTS